MAGVIFAPIEPIEERYSAQWLGWFRREFDCRGESVIEVGNLVPQTIEVGEFLDAYGTNIFKARQLAEILDLLRQGFEGTLFLMDAWYPGLEAIAYAKDVAGAKVKVVGIFHAGTWDPWDHLTQSGCALWAESVERGWMSILDKVLVATEFHKSLLVKERGCDPEKVRVVRFPVFADSSGMYSVQWEHKEDVVVFPHRLAPEKAPEVFEELERKYLALYGPGPRFVRTKDVCETKEDYYRLLGKSKVAFSSALQETFGIAMQEAWNLGCVPVAPRRLSYVETIPEEWLYDDLEDAVSMVRDALQFRGWSVPGGSRYNELVDDIVAEILST